MRRDKIVRPVMTKIANMPVNGYEIHHGRTAVHGGEPLLLNGDDRGCVVGRVAGCHVHGLFVSAAVRRHLLGHGSEAEGGDPFDRWADHLQDNGLVARDLLQRC